MRRREFLGVFGGAVATWPATARAQQGERVRRIGVLQAVSESDLEGQRRIAAFVQGLQKFGWTEGANLRIDYRWGGADSDRLRRYAAEIVGLQPPGILPSGPLG